MSTRTGQQAHGDEQVEYREPILGSQESVTSTPEMIDIMRGLVRENQEATLENARLRRATNGLRRATICLTWATGLLVVVTVEPVVRALLS